MGQNLEATVGVAAGVGEAVGERVHDHDLGVRDRLVAVAEDDAGDL